MDLKEEKSAEIDLKKIRKSKGDKNLSRVLMSLVLVLILILSGIQIFRNSNKSFDCGDGTLNRECSPRQPYFCLEGSLIERAVLCDCPEKSIVQEGNCIYQYQFAPMEIELPYMLDGEQNVLEFTVYSGLDDYLSKLPKSISYDGGEQPSIQDFKLRNLNEEEQRLLLLPLVTEIQNLVENKDDQARIAISLVQNIPYGKSKESVTLVHGPQVDYSRYPYEVLYDNEGICGEKSELLAFLLRELGYGVVLFYHPAENHESVGIKCPSEYSLDNSGYCFVETTGPSIITDSEIDYAEIGKLAPEIEITFISEGNSLGEGLEEYDDARELIEIRESSEKNGGINMFEARRLKKLQEKYNLLDVYYSS